MLLVTLTIAPGGDRSRAYAIGEMEIANVTDLAPVSDYHVRTRSRPMGSQRWSEWASCAVKRFPRVLGAFELVRCAIEEMTS